MKLSDVIALIGAGYTKAEIDALEAGNKPEETTVTEAKPEPQPEAKSEPKPEPKPEPTNAGNKELLDAITNLTAAVQARNVRESKQPAEVEKPKDIMKEASDVLLNLYNN